MHSETTAPHAAKHGALSRRGCVLAQWQATGGLAPPAPSPPP